MKAKIKKFTVHFLQPVATYNIEAKDEEQAIQQCQGKLKHFEYDHDEYGQ
jgi:hypothetical protein